MHSEVVVGGVYTGVYAVVALLLVVLSRRAVQVIEVSSLFHQDSAAGRELSRQAISTETPFRFGEEETLGKLGVIGHVTALLYRLVAVMAVGSPAAIWLGHLGWGGTPWLRLFVIGMVPVLLPAGASWLLAFRAIRLTRLLNRGVTSRDGQDHRAYR